MNKSELKLSSRTDPERSRGISVEIVFEEFKNGNWFKVTKNGKVAKESKTISFNTGKEPSTVDQSNIAVSYPGYRAFNYYKEEASGNFITLDIGQPKLFQPGAEWVQKAKITPVLGGQPKYISYTYDNAGNQINFSLPREMDNNKIYRLDLVNLPAGSAMALDQNVTQQKSNVNIESEGYKTEVEITTQNAETSREELHEKVIYSMDFRTSNYNTFSQKLNALNCSNGISWELYPLVHSLTVNITGERFDNYEVVNLKEKTMVSCEILLAETDWYQKYIAPFIELSTTDLALIGADKFSLPFLSSYLFQSNGTRRLTDDEVKSGMADDVQVLSGMKNYIAKYSSEYMYILKNKIANTRANGGILTAQLSNLLNSSFTPLKYGNYPVNIKYTIPGQDKPNSIKKHVIQFVD